MEGPTSSQETISIGFYLDDQTEPLATYRPPAAFQLDTSRLEDGEHVLHVRAVDALGNVGRRSIPFRVANGPGITVTGLRPGTTVHGILDLNVNALSGAEPFDPERGESHGPIPVWMWVLCAVVAAWASWYGIEFFATPPDFADTPTYAANAALASANAPAAGAAVVRPPAYSGKGSAGGFDYAATGAPLYAQNCSACHGVTGAGVPGAFPALAGDPVVTSADPLRQIRTVLNGLHGQTIGGKEYAGQMPPFSQFSDADIAAIVDHERTSWGNNAPIITPSDVRRAR